MTARVTTPAQAARAEADYRAGRDAGQAEASGRDDLSMVPVVDGSPRTGPAGA